MKYVKDYDLIIVIGLLKKIIRYIESEHNININTKIIYPKKQREKEKVLSKEEFMNLNQILLKDIDPCKFGVLVAMQLDLESVNYAL